MGTTIKCPCLIFLCVNRYCLVLPCYWGPHMRIGSTMTHSHSLTQYFQYLLPVSALCRRHGARLSTPSSLSNRIAFNYLHKQRSISTILDLSWSKARARLHLESHCDQHGRCNCTDSTIVLQSQRTLSSSKCCNNALPTLSTVQLVISYFHQGLQSTYQSIMFLHSSLVNLLFTVRTCYVESENLRTKVEGLSSISMISVCLVRDHKTIICLLRESLVN